MTSPGFGWVVDDAGPRKRDAGGAAEFARALAEGTIAGPCDPAVCPTCGLLDEPGGCVGVIEAPLAPAAEKWLIDRLPASLDSLAGRLLRQNLKEGAVSGAGGEALRKAGFLVSGKPVARHYGPFFRGHTVTSDQIIEEMLCAGDVQPAHALAILVHLGAVTVDGAAPEAAEAGAALATVVQRPGDRPERVKCTLRLAAADATPDDRSVAQLERFLRGLYAAFVQDTEVRVLG